MINYKKIIECLKENEIKFITGVPDSTLKHIICAIADDKDFQHVPATNEGEAVALAAGYFFATGKVPMVYMQNDGLFNAANALASLCSFNVYDVPMLLMIGKRGIEGDEPQHLMAGEMLEDFLKLLHIPCNYQHIENNENIEDEILEDLSSAIIYARREIRPAAIIFQKGSIYDLEEKNKIGTTEPSMREKCLDILLNYIGIGIVVSTTGLTSRELYELRKKRGEKTDDILMVGSMGCASAIGLGVALQENNDYQHDKSSYRNVYVLDGDGAALMMLGNMATIGYYLPENLVHIIFDNGGYVSTGKQQRIGDRINWQMLAQGLGYYTFKEVDGRSMAETKCFGKLGEILDFHKMPMPALIVIKIDQSVRGDLGRPKDLKEIRKNFMIKIFNKDI